MNYAKVLAFRGGDRGLAEREVRIAAAQSLDVPDDPDRDVQCARQAWLKRKEVANLKLQITTRGESPIGDDGGRHAESESCVTVKT